MAFRFRSSKSDHKIHSHLDAKNSASSLDIKNNITKQYQDAADNAKIEPNNTVSSKFTNSQLNKLTKAFPIWLRSNNNLKHLPGIYQGVLGQVQSQPTFLHADNGKLVDKTSTTSQLTNFGGPSFLAQQSELDYMNRFTDTERVQQLLSTSQLPNETLATIWAHVNKTFPGKLTNREVCLALALIALFQKKIFTGSNSDKSLDPFNQVKLEKKPPVPRLYPIQNNPSTVNKSTNGNDIKLQTNFILIDIQDELNGCNTEPTYCDDALGSNEVTKSKSSDDLMNLNTPKKSLFSNIKIQKHFNDCISLIDDDGLKLDAFLCNLCEMWMKSLKTIGIIFKRSFDILNVDHCRPSAIEALRSERGKLFSKQLSLCYPMAHNIRQKVLQLSNIKLNSENGCDDNKNNLFDKNYISQVDDLMTSINEYWAVLINLFHESGQTKFIEFIMDGLNFITENSTTLDELVNLLIMNEPKKDICCICLSKFYLVNESANTDGLDDVDLDLLGDNKRLITNDDYYYYHARCANFWMNNVIDSNGIMNMGSLPFEKLNEDSILSPNQMRQ